MTTHLYTIRRNGKVVGYRYRRPEGYQPREVTLSVYTAQEAKNAAEQLNTIYYGGADAVEAVTGRHHGHRRGTLTLYLKNNLARIMRDRSLKPRTQKDWEGQRRHIEDHLGHRDPRTIQRADAVSFLGQWNDYPGQRNRYRSVLNIIWSYLVEEGWADDNPWPKTRRLRPAKVKRVRLTLEAYKAIYQATYEALPDVGPAIRNAMDLALHTLQRRTDIAQWCKNTYQDDTLEVIQSKTGAAIRIHVGPPLATILRRCTQDNIISQHIIHQPATKATAHKKRAALPLSPESLTRGFKTARDLTGLYDHLDAETETPPTWHEIRALGAELYRKAGIPEKHIQELLGHETPEQTRLYLSRHEKEYVEVFGGLDL